MVIDICGVISRTFNSSGTCAQTTSGEKLRVPPRHKKIVTGERWINLK